MLNDISLKLLFGEPIDIDIAKVYPLKIKEIIEMSEQLYNQYLSTLLYDIDLIDINKEQLEQLGIEKFTTYHFLALNSLNNMDFKQLVINALETFLKEKVYFHEEAFIFYLVDANYTEPFLVDNEVYYKTSNGNFKKKNKDTIDSVSEEEFFHKLIQFNIMNSNIKPITLEVYELFKKVLIKQNFLKELEEEEELIFGNEMARQWYLEIKRKERTRPRPKSNVDLQSIISGVRWHGKISKEEILKMTIYELYDGYYRLSIIDNCINLTQGIYHGTINQKGVKDNDLNWVKIIKFDKN